MIRVKRHAAAAFVFFATFASGTVTLHSTARAQEPGNVDIDRWTPTLDADGLMSIQASRTPGHLQWNVGLLSNYLHRPFSLESDGQRSTFVGTRLQSYFVGQLGIGDRFALGLTLPVVWYQDINEGLPQSNGIDNAAVGNPKVSARYRFWGKPSQPIRDANEGAGLAAQLDVFMPIGSQHAWAAEDRLRTHLQLIGDVHLLGAAAAVTLGWRHRFGTQEWFGITLRDELHAGLGLEVPIPSDYNLSGLAEFRLITDAGNPFGSSFTTVAENDFGVRMRLGDFAITTSAGLGYTEAYGSAAWHLGLAFHWAPRVHDTDNDGIIDSKDMCPYLPEDHDGFQDADGCLDPDDDGDLIPDEEDKCPKDSAAEGRDLNEDGCTDQ